METLKVETIRAVQNLALGDLFLDGVNGDYSSDTEEKLKQEIIDIIVKEKYE
jgi:hypothetical protein